MNRRFVKALLGCIISGFVLTLLFPTDALAVNKANTYFCCPDFGTTEGVPSNVISTEDVWYEEWGYGHNLNLLNLSGLDAVISEGLSIGKPKGTSNDCVGIYVEGADLSTSNVNALASAGWKRLELYYGTFMVSSILSSTDATFAPRVAKTEDSRVAKLLSQAGVTEQYGLVSMTGITLTNFGVILYEPSFIFLSGQNYVYKYRPYTNCFEYVGEGYNNSYDRGFVEVYDLVPIDGSCDGVYMFVNSELPEELLEPREVQSFLTFHNPQSEVIEDSALPKELEELGEILISTNDQGEISLDIPYSGKLPEGSSLSVILPEDNPYVDGTTLYLYYVNENQIHEFVSGSTCMAGWATFAIEHCSEYIVTDIDHGASYSYEVPEETAVESEEETLEADMEESLIEIQDELSAIAVEETVETATAAESGSLMGSTLMIVMIVAFILFGIGATVLMIKKK